MPTVNEYEQQLIASLSKSMAVMCVRNIVLEDIHGGIEPVSHTGDFSDVEVTDANGRRIPWMEVSRIGQEEMRDLMRQVVNRLYTFQAKSHDPHFVAMMVPGGPHTRVGWRASTRSARVAASSLGRSV